MHSPLYYSIRLYDLELLSEPVSKAEASVLVGYGPTCALRPTDILNLVDFTLCFSVGEGGRARLAARPSHYLQVSRSEGFQLAGIVGSLSSLGSTSSGGVFAFISLGFSYRSFHPVWTIHSVCY